MNKFECLHETPIRTALDLIDLIDNHDIEEVLDRTKRSPYASTSIARIASNMTLVFPVMASNTLHIDTDMMLMKAIERKAAIMLQILFSAYQVTDVKDAQEFISRFHSNIRLSGKATIDDFIALGDALSENTSLTVDKTTLNKLSKDFRENCFFVLEDDIAPTSIAQNYMGINEERMTFGPGIDNPASKSRSFGSREYGKSQRNKERAYNAQKELERMAEKNKEDLSGRRPTVTYSSSNRRKSSFNSGYPEDNRNNGRDYSEYPDPVDLSPDDTQGIGDMKAASTIAKSNSKKMDDKHEGPVHDKDFHNDMSIKNMKDMAGYFQAQIMDSDIKKANELVPTTMVVNFTTIHPKSGRAIPVENVVIGIKARLIPVDSDDIVNHILTKLNDKNYVLQLIRATTREISFFKDFLFAVDNAKIEALANSKRGSANPMWKVLERLAIKSRFNRFVGIKGNNANAITTLVVSQEEVDYVRKNYGKNLDSIKNINAILDAYNLMGFVVVDESLEVAKFKFDDGEDFFETLSFSTLEKEAGDNSYKKIVNLMSKLA